MTAIFVGSLFPASLKQEIATSSIGPMANANSTLQHALVAGLSQYYHELSVINLPQVGAYPFRYRKLFVPGSEVTINGRVSGRSLTFFNLIGVKNLSRYWRARRELSRMLKAATGEATVFVYDLHAPFLKAVSDVKGKYKNMKVCVIVPDLPGFTGEKSSILLELYSRVMHDALQESYGGVDAFVLLSKHMAERLPVEGKPWVVVEGIYNEQEEPCRAAVERSPYKTVFYSGAVSQRNGVERLLAAFQMIRQEDYRLVICGDGESRSVVEAAAGNDARVVYKGQIPRDEVLGEQRAATLLVNPRTAEGEFTRFSFPSKTMEYLASGVPVLLYPLEGIPEEYYEFCYTLDDLSVEKLAEAIVQICDQPAATLEQKANAAKAFVLGEKNPSVQCKKISDMMRSIQE
jgi:glycosyltransferase involved in cell wall biosynthesis